MDKKRNADPEQAQSKKQDKKRGKKQPGLRICSLFSVAGILGAALFLSMMFSLDMIQTGFSPILKTISDLVYGSYGWLQTLAFVRLGVLFFAFIIKLYSMTVRKTASLTGVSSFGFTSIGFILIAAFPSQTGFELTLPGLIHNSVAGLISGSFIFGCIAFAVHFRSDPRWRRYWFLTAMTVILCITFALLWALIPQEWPLRALSERLVLISGLIWVSVISVKLVRICAESRKVPIPIEE